MASTRFVLSIDNSKESYLNFEGILTNKEKIMYEGDKAINYNYIIDLKERAMFKENWEMKKKRKYLIYINYSLKELMK